ncbi:MAG: hypothetical protein ACJZ49_07355 [Candidatus Thalassarchaeaceae archaeon]
MGPVELVVFAFLFCGIPGFVFVFLYRLIFITAKAKQNVNVIVNTSTEQAPTQSPTMIVHNTNYNIHDSVISESSIGNDQQ